MARGLAALVLMCAVLTIWGCDGDGGGGANFAAVTSRALENQTFTFAEGATFGLAGQAITLTFGDFDDGDGNPNTGPFTLQAGGNTATGTVTLASCQYVVASSTIATLPLGTTILHNPCDVDQQTGAYRGVNTVTGAMASSGSPTPSEAPRLATPSRSTTIALTSDDRRLVVVNRETNSVAILEVRGPNGQDTTTTLAELAVGQEPRFVAVHPNNREAYVSNTVSGNVSVIALTGVDAFRVVAEIPVGTEPRGLALTPNGTRLLVANHTAGTVSIIDVAARTVINTVTVGGNLAAIAIANDGDADDTDERVFVTQFYAELIPGGPGEASDTGKRGIVQTFTVGNPATLTRVTLSPLATSGFTADRSPFCPQSTTIVLHSTLFCPDLAAAPGSDVLVRDPQGVFPNQLQAALIRGTRLYLPNNGAQPEPPVRFNVNVQALVHVVDTTQVAERADLHVNLNQQVLPERTAGNTTGINGLAATNIIRYQTGHLPNGVVMSRDGRRAYTNKEAGVSVTAINLDTNTVLTRDIATGEVPNPGTFAHGVLVGKIAFFTALGLPDNGLFDTPIRNLVPLDHRGKASDNAWSGCGSCHPDGLADGVTWIFATGPRQTVPLDAFFAKDHPDDQRISNWSAVMGSITDFNGNSRGVQGGCGFASDDFRGTTPCSPTAPANPDIFQHGITQGASDALDAMTLWVQTVRAPILPAGNASAVAAGRTVFAANCASCHGGAKWTKSQVLYANNPTFTANPAPPTGVTPGVPRDPGVTNAGAQIVSYTSAGETLQFLENAATFDATDPLEIRANGTTALGALGFNVPALLGVAYHGPYLHHGEAQTLEAVFPLHGLPGGGTIATALSAAQQADLLAFLRALDGRTDQLRSAADAFRDAVAD